MSKPIIIVGYGNAEAISFYEVVKSLEDVRIAMGGVVESCDILKQEASKLADTFEINDISYFENLHSKRRKKSWQKNKFYE